jgi:hypothetical protein
VAAQDTADVGVCVDSSHAETGGGGGGGHSARRAEASAAAAGAGRENLADGEPGAGSRAGEARVIAWAAAGTASPLAGLTGLDASSASKASHGHDACRSCAGAPRAWRSVGASDSCSVAGATGLDGADRAEAGAAVESEVAQSAWAESGAAAGSWAAAGPTAGKAGQQAANSPQMVAELKSAGTTAARPTAISNGVEAGAESETAARTSQRPATHLAVVHLLRRAVRLTSEGNAGELKLQVRHACRPSAVLVSASDKGPCGGISARLSFGAQQR